MATGNCFLEKNTLESVRRVITRELNRSGKINIPLAFNTPFSAKPSGIRMGKGKGKLVGWIAQLSPGVNLFELKNARPGRAVYFFKQVTHRLPVKSKLIRKTILKVPLL